MIAQWGGWLREGGNPNSTDSANVGVMMRGLLQLHIPDMQVAGWGIRLQKLTRHNKGLVVQACHATIDGMSAKLLHDPEVPLSVRTEDNYLSSWGPQPRKCSGWYSLLHPVLRTQDGHRHWGVSRVLVKFSGERTDWQMGLADRRKGDWSTALDPTTVP